jgi:hypothetical protein
MLVAEKFGGKYDIMSYLPPTVLYLLASPSTPESAVSWPRAAMRKLCVNYT